MKKVLLINGSYGGSTGKICRTLMKFKKNDFDVYFAFGHIFSGKTDSNSYCYCNNSLVNNYQKIITKISGGDGFHNYFSTIKLLSIIKKVKPDLVHIHNIHGYTTNLRILLNYLKKKNIKVVFTMHDCWLFTGRCAHFDFNKCDKWCDGSECRKCSFMREYPYSLVFDKAHHFWKIKKKLFESNLDIVFVSPSKWLANLAMKSFLSKHRIEVINNGVEISEFEKTLNVDLSKEKYFQKYKIILAAASVFDDRKGIKDILSLSKLLPGNTFKIYLAGSVSNIDLSSYSNIEYLGPVNNNKLLSLMELADVFICPTYQDTFPTVIIESLSQGTPVVSYDTGGCKELINHDVGKIVDKGDVSAMLQSIIEIVNEPSKKISCKLEALNKSKYG